MILMRSQGCNTQGMCLPGQFFADFVSVFPDPVFTDPVDSALSSLPVCVVLV